MRQRNTKRVESFKPGQKLTAAWTKDVADIVNDVSREFSDPAATQPYGYIDADHTAFKLFEFDVEAVNTLHRNNVLSLAVKQPENSSNVLLTSGSRSLKADVPAPLIPVLANRTYKMQAVVGADAPVKGEQCGVFDGHVIDNRGSGFIALSAPFTEGSLSLVWVLKNASGGSTLKAFQMAESWTNARRWYWANPMTALGGVDSTKFEKVYGLSTDHLMHFKFNWRVITGDIDGLNMFLQAVECIPSDCNVVSGSQPISGNNFPSGQVGSSYTASIGTVGLSGPLTVNTGMPPGLNLSGTTVSGTPTTAGTYYLIVDGSRVVTGFACSFRRVFQIVIAEEPE